MGNLKPLPQVSGSSQFGKLSAGAKGPPAQEATTLVNQTLEQEYKADRILTELAEGSLNRQTAAGIQSRNVANGAGFPRAVLLLPP